MPLGTEVGLGPGDVVLDGDPSFPQRMGRFNLISARILHVVLFLLAASSAS